MSRPLFHSRVIAVIWDFDQTLIPGYQQRPLFEHFDIEPQTFWNEVNGLADYYAGQGVVVSRDTVYLNHLLTYVAEGRCPGLSNKLLRELGGRLRFYRGMPAFLQRATNLVATNERYTKTGITVEHYVVSTGLRQMILGSRIAKYVEGIWGCDFIEAPAASGFLAAPAKAPPDAGVIRQVGYFLDNTTKTRAIWEINKGCNKDSNIGVNDLIAQDDRRVPLQNMIYIADGPSDVPVFSILNHYGGRTLGVYNPENEAHYEQVAILESQSRVQHASSADYRDNQDASRWILRQIRDIAELIVKDREQLRATHVQAAAKHVI